MAQKINVVMLDDIDGQPATETVQFSLDGKTFEIDLSEENAKIFRDSLSSYIEHARPSKIRTSKPRPSTSDSAKVRAWAKEQGIHVNERGRIPESLMNEYRSQTGS
jgi:hypothetical protein